MIGGAVRVVNHEFEIQKSLPGEVIEQDAGGDGDIQRIGAGTHRDRNPLVAAGDPAMIKTVGLGAHDDRQAIGPRKAVDRLGIGIGDGGDELEAAGCSQAIKLRRGVVADDHGEVEHRTH